MSLSGQTALVTGASRGLGRAIARRLAREGAAVWVNYVSRGSDADKVVEEIHSAGGRANAIRAEIGRLPGVVAHPVVEHRVTGPGVEGE